jgi:hypothetical protein
MSHEAEKEVMITCPSCGSLSRHRGLCTFERFGGSPNDPYFGLPLWLQAPCCDHILWAYNAEHLSKLRQYVAASLRQRVTPKHPMAWSMFARLPQWMSAAKNREAVLSTFDRLRKKLDIIPMEQQSPSSMGSSASS